MKNLKRSLDLLVSQSNRCIEILKKLYLNPKINDEFLNTNFTLFEYINEIVRSFQEISNKKFDINITEFKNKIRIGKSTEIMYGLRNFIGNANKFSKKKINIILLNRENSTIIKILDDGDGFPADLIKKEMLGEPYIRTLNNAQNSKQGLGLGTFIGKTLLEKNFASVKFKTPKI